MFEPPTQEESVAERWTNVGHAKQVWGQDGKIGAITTAHMCTACLLVPNDDSVATTVKEALGPCRRVPASRRCLVSCSAATALVPAWFSWWSHHSLGHCNNFLDAVIMANNVHQPGSKARALESLSVDKMSKLADVWYERVEILEVVRYLEGAKLKI